MLISQIVDSSNGQMVEVVEIVEIVQVVKAIGEVLTLLN